MRKKFIGLAAMAAVASLALAGCGGADKPADDKGAPAEGGTSTGIVTANGTEPQNPLIPTMTNEVGGGRILDLIGAGPIYYAADGSIHNDLAEKIEQNEDGTLFTITLRAGQVFSDGTPIKAENFVQSWNYGADLANAHLSASFFEPIKGYSDEVSVPEMEGLKVVDDLTFTAEMSEPTLDFAERLGYSAFQVLPAVAFEDIAAYGENPLASGPYKLAKEGAWVHNEQIELVPNEKYQGERKPQNGGVTFRFYAQQDAAYADLLSGNLDITDAIPDSAMSTFETELGDRAINQASAVFQSFTWPKSDERFQGDAGVLRRKAMSYAINRDEITKTIFSGSRIPAKDFTSPVVEGWTDKVEGNEVLTYDPEKAKELWAQAEAISPWTGKFELAYNADGGHQAWADAVANSIKNVLGIDAEGKAYPDFKSLRSDVTERRITTAFRTGWQADYPSQFNFLYPLYASNAGSNDGDYANPEFDKLVKEGLLSDDASERAAKYNEAQVLMFKDMTVMPLWYANVTGGYAETVTNVKFGWNSVPVYYEVQKQA
ncbi:MAG: ABC transporter substrate-binding protein [Actinomycetaceae bacterium]|nr:ABC transporter substrate-binding protein [Actinomycetaceae bacterium]